MCEPVELGGREETRSSCVYSVRPVKYVAVARHIAPPEGSVNPTANADATAWVCGVEDGRPIYTWAKVGNAEASPGLGEEA